MRGMALNPLLTTVVSLSLHFQSFLRATYLNLTWVTFVLCLLKVQLQFWKDKVDGNLMLLGWSRLGCIGTKSGKIGLVGKASFVTFVFYSFQINPKANPVTCSLIPYHLNFSREDIHSCVSGIIRHAFVFWHGRTIGLFHLVQFMLINIWFDLIWWPTYPILLE